MSQISLQSGPKISLPVVANMFWDHFFVARSSTLQTSIRIDCFRTHGFPLSSNGSANVKHSEIIIR